MGINSQARKGLNTDQGADCIIANRCHKQPSQAALRLKKRSWHARFTNHPLHIRAPISAGAIKTIQNQNEACYSDYIFCDLAPGYPWFCRGKQPTVITKLQLPQKQMRGNIS